MKVLTVSLAFMTSVLIGCGRNDRQSVEPTPQDPVASPASNSGMSTPTSVADVMNNPAQFLDQRVVLSGEVNQVWTPRAFSIGGQQFLENDTLLVVSREDLPRIAAREAHDRIAPADIVQVSGTVRRGPLAEVERETSFDLPAAAEQVWSEDRPVLVAERVVVTPRRIVRP